MALLLAEERRQRLAEIVSQRGFVSLNELVEATGASESTNIILARTRAYIENSAIGSDADKVGTVDLGANGSAQIDALGRTAV